MNYKETVLDLIGNTPMVKLQQMADSSMATVLAKLEYLNPAGSVKDRMAFNMIRRAEERGDVKAGATIVESTSGNTGLGLAITCAVRGYKLVITIPDKMSQEKIDMLKAFGAEVIVTPTKVDHHDPRSYVEVAKRVARETPNSFYTDQYSNMDNPEAHYLTTGPEIWNDTQGKIDALVGTIGTGGTVSGAGKYLKEKAKEANKDFQIICPDPEGSIYYDVFNKCDVREPSVYKVEGIGHDWMVDTLDFSVIDRVMQISDRDSFIASRRLAREEGILVGGSSGTAVHGAIEVAKELGPDKLVVVIICDHGDRYISKIFNDEWMKDNGFLEHGQRLGKISELLKFKGGKVEFADCSESVAEVAARMNSLGISQMPVKRNGGGINLMVHESDLLQSLLAGQCNPADKVGDLASELQGIVSPADPVSRLNPIFEENNVAVVVDGDDVTGIISKIDLVRFISAKSQG